MDGLGMVIDQVYLHPVVEHVEDPSEWVFDHCTATLD